MLHCECLNPPAEIGMHALSVLPYYNTQVQNWQFCLRAVNLSAKEKLGQKIQNVFVLDEMRINEVALK